MTERDAFLRLKRRGSIWMDLRLHTAFLLLFTGELRPVTPDRAQLTGFISRIIDCRRAFTATCSAGAAAAAEAHYEEIGRLRADCARREGARCLSFPERQ